MANNVTRGKIKFLLFYWIPVIAWAIVIFSFSGKSTYAVSVVQWQDFILKKSMHVIEYAIFTMLLYRAIKKSGMSVKKALAVAAVTAIIYGATDEFHQSFTPGREPKVRDVFFDGMGSVLMLYFISTLLPRMPLKIKGLANKIDIL